MFVASLCCENRIALKRLLELRETACSFSASRRCISQQIPEGFRIQKVYSAYKVREYSQLINKRWILQLITEKSNFPNHQIWSYVVSLLRKEMHDCVEIWKANKAVGQISVKTSKMLHKTECKVQWLWIPLQFLWLSENLLYPHHVTFTTSVPAAWRIEGTVKKDEACEEGHKKRGQVWMPLSLTDGKGRGINPFQRVRRWWLRGKIR